VEALEEIKALIREKNPELLLTFKEPIFMTDLEESDIYSFYKENMEHFLRTIDFLEFLEEYPDSYFPLNERILKSIYEKTSGNPRQIIKQFIKIFNEIIYANEKIEDIIRSYDIVV